MSRPRPVFAGDIIHIQRRTRDGRFFLVPRPETLALVQYAYGLAAKRCGLVLHAVCVMSNHLHVVATDPEGRHPEFTRCAHRLIALGLKEMHGIQGAVWAEGGVSVQRLVGSTAVLEALAYVRINPVAAGCVRDECVYPGVFGANAVAPFETYARTQPRPACFGETSTLPDTVIFSVEAPHLLLEELGTERFARELGYAVERQRIEAIQARLDSGGGFLGLRRVLAADVWTRPKCPPKRAGFTPTFKGVLAEAIIAARKTLRAFRQAYAEALALFRAGHREVAFPPGTYMMQRNLGCRAMHGAC